MIRTAARLSAVVCLALTGIAIGEASPDGGNFASHPRSLQQTVSEMNTMPPVPDFTVPIPMLYNDTAFVKNATSNEASPSPSCCSAMMSAATAGRRLKQADITDECPMGTTLLGSSQTGHWGYWYDLLEPALVIGNDTVIDVEMPTFVAGQAWSEMGKGDPGMEDIYSWDPVTGPRVAFKGPTGTTGGHYMTGPIYVCGAEAGDVLEVQILDLLPRPNPQNESFGVTTAFSIGWWNRTGYSTPGYAPSRNGAIVYKAIKDPDTGRPQYWEPQYLFDDSSPLNNRTVSGCVPTVGELPRTTANGDGYYDNSGRMYGGATVPCVDGMQNFSGSGYSGLVYDSPEDIRDYSVKGKWRIPVNMHIGNMGLAPVVGAPISTAPPLRSGGNIDNKRIGIGATMYYPVEAAGALLSMGDCHGSQGDGESVATGVETSLNGRFRIILHKADSLPTKLQLINYPMLENPNELIIHGYAYQDWIREIPNPQVNVGQVGPVGGVDLNRAMSTVYNETRAFLIHNYNLTEDMAINIMSLGVDFEITQVVDSNVGIHAKIPKWLFNSTLWETEPYYEAAVKTGTSRTSYP